MLFDTMIPAGFITTKSAADSQRVNVALVRVGIIEIVCMYISKTYGVIMYMFSDEFK